jgi:hypothetical protein
LGWSGRYGGEDDELGERKRSKRFFLKKEAKTFANGAVHG